MLIVSEQESSLKLLAIALVAGILIAILDLIRGEQNIGLSVSKKVQKIIKLIESIQVGLTIGAIVYITLYFTPIIQKGMICKSLLYTLLGGLMLGIILYLKIYRKQCY